MSSSTAPDIILTNGKITTLDRAQPETRELAIKHGRIITGGERGPATRVIDLGGRRVIPGLNDSHLHVIRAGLYYNMELRWKVAVVTLLGVYPVSLVIGLTFAPPLHKLPLALNLFVVSALIVACLTWLVMPALTKLFHQWLQTHER
jgi:hypothetical protein